MRVAVVPCFVWCVTLSLAAQNTHSAHRAPKATDAGAVKPDSTALRVTHVSLYKNGVGFFEHEGRVTGDASVSLDLTSAQLNDVLQSLTAVDLGGGHVTGANYNSTTPLDQQLRTLPLNLGEQPSEQDLYNALRGARVEVSGSGGTFTGRLLSLEIRPAVASEGDGNKPVAERRFVTVIADSGATRTLELGSNTVVRLLDAGLRADLNTYLTLLDRNRTDSVRHLLLTDRGTGTRDLRVSFLSEVPVWKSTYRVLLTTGGANGTTGDGSATVQGFSVVDNTTGEDWNGVRLSLIAGSPQSFLQPISQPIYDRRPEVPIAENAQTTPQTHESGEGKEPPPGSASAEFSDGVGGSPAALFGSPTGTGAGTAGPVVAMSRKVPRGAPTASPSMVPHAAAANPEMIEQLLRSSTQVNATTSSFDDFFAYNLTDPVTIPRNGSALVPILQTRLPVESITLWSRSAPRPLRALWMTNSSDLTLDRGSFSVVENGAFAGEGLIDPLHPGERRLLSYAVDQAVFVTPESSTDVSRISSVTVSGGVLRASNVQVAEAKYRVRNAAAESRTVILEEPRRAGWTLDESAKPAETTPGLYRFRVPVPAHGSAELSVSQRQTVGQEFMLASTSEEQITFFLRTNGADPNILAQLQPVFAARRRVAQIDAQIAQTNRKIAAIGDDQARVRQNLQALKGSAEERALAKRYTGELNAQEDTLTGLKRELDGLQQQRTGAEADLAHQIETLRIA